MNLYYVFSTSRTGEERYEGEFYTYADAARYRDTLQDRYDYPRVWTEAGKRLTSAKSVE